MRPTQQYGRPTPRSGFTVSELLVVIGVSILLAALILPNLQTARVGSRRTECLNNIRNLGISTQSYATMQKGRLPFLIDIDQPLNWGTTDAPRNSASPWTVQVLPYIEHGPLAERLVTASNSEAVPEDFRMENLASVRIKVFNCPEDRNESGSGDLSYAINTGYVGADFFGQDVIYDYDPVALRGLTPRRQHATGLYDYPSASTSPTPDAEIARATGIAWPDAQVSMDEVTRADGSTFTLLLAENLQSQRWAGRAPHIDRSAAPTIDYEISDLSFGLPVRVTGAGPYVVSDRATSPLDGVGDPAMGDNDAKPLTLAANWTGALTGSLRDGRINQNFDSATEGETPRPSSRHKGGVNVIFVAGNGKFLAESIDTRLYAELLTWDGTQLGQSAISNTDF